MDLPTTTALWTYPWPTYRLDARNAFADTRPPERLSLFDGYFSGPLGKSKKTTFQVSASQKQDDRQAIVYAQLPSGTLIEICQPTE